MATQVYIISSNCYVPITMPFSGRTILLGSEDNRATEHDPEEPRLFNDNVLIAHIILRQMTGEELER
jgi:hypothetical protein